MYADQPRIGRWMVRGGAGSLSRLRLDPADDSDLPTPPGFVKIQVAKTLASFRRARVRLCVCVSECV